MPPAAVWAIQSGRDAQPLTIFKRVALGAGDGPIGEVGAGVVGAAGHSHELLLPQAWHLRLPGQYSATDARGLQQFLLLELHGIHSAVDDCESVRAGAGGHCGDAGLGDGEEPPPPQPAKQIDKESSAETPNEASNVLCFMFG